jgi:DNA-binding response OmpR family regulator
MNVMVISAAAETGAWLARILEPHGFQVVTAMPGPGLIQQVRERRPDVAVLDGIDTRPQLAQMEVALLKDQSPGIRIIAISAESSEHDVEVIEQGIFCYLGGCSLQQLLSAVLSAARSRAGDRAQPNINLRSVP